MFLIIINLINDDLIKEKIKLKKKKKEKVKVSRLTMRDLAEGQITIQKMISKSLEVRKKALHL